ncbi:MAG: helix-turn-helix transcriptional regulator [Bacteroides sp.]|nr:helix-turn-helix transcriptional regulator [Bacteroides sp.]
MTNHSFLQKHPLQEFTDAEKEIADILGISVNTVKYHKRTILRQLNVSNTAEAVQWMNSQKKLSEE